MSQHITDQDLLLIEKYLSNNLSERDRADFEKRITNAAFTDELRFQQNLKQVIYSEKEIALKRILEQEEILIQNSKVHQNGRSFSGQESSDDGPRINPSLPNAVGTFTINRRRLFLAASFMILVTISIVVFWNRPFSSQDLYVRNFNPYPAINETTRGDQPDNIITEAMSFYIVGNYEQSVESFDKLPSQSIDNDMLFYKANAMLALDETEAAGQILKELANIEFDYQMEAQWYLSLYYLKIDDTGNAREILTSIADNPYHGNQEDAKKMLRKLKP